MFSPQLRNRDTLHACHKKGAPCVGEFRRSKPTPKGHGRIDQAIEFPLPDDNSRRKLVKLYSRGLSVGEEVLETTVRKTKGSSPAFIKELMRRSAQFQFEDRSGGDGLMLSSVNGALQEMVFSGGALNLRLLGGSTPELSSSSVD